MKIKSLGYARRDVFTVPAVHKRTKRTIFNTARKVGMKPSPCVITQPDKVSA